VVYENGSYHNLFQDMPLPENCLERFEDDDDDDDDKVKK
jgi:hypothetical protein